MRTGLWLAIAAQAAAIVVLGTLLLMRDRTPAPVFTAPPDTESSSATLLERSAARVTDLPGSNAALHSTGLERTRLVDAKQAAPVGLIVFGSVQSKDGSIPDRGHVHVLDANQDTVGFAKCDARGFAIAGLAAGSYTVVAQADAHRGASVELDLDGTLARVRHDFTLEPALRVEVFLDDENGEPLEADPGAFGFEGVIQGALPLWVTAVPAPPGERLLSLRARQPDDVRWHAGVGDPSSLGILEIRHPLPAHVAAVLGERVLATAPLAPGQDSIRLRLPPDAMDEVRASLVVQVFDRRTGLPIEGAEALLTSMPPRQTDGEGSASWPRTLPGIQALQVRAEGYFPEERLVDLPLSDATKSLRVEMAPVVPLRGVVVDPDGEPVEGCVVLARSLAKTQQDPTSWAHLSNALDTGSDGRFAIPSPEGPILVRAWSPGRWAGHAVVDPSTLGEEGLVLRVEPGPQVWIRFDEPLAAHSVVIRDGEGHPAAWGPGAGVVILQIAPGEYTLEVHGLDGRRRTQALTVPAQSAAVRVRAR